MNSPIRTMNTIFTGTTYDIKYIKAANSYVNAAKNYDPSRWSQSVERMLSLKVLIAVILEVEDLYNKRRIDTESDFETPPVAATLLHDRAHEVTRYLNCLSNTEKIDSNLTWWKSTVPVSRSFDLLLPKGKYRETRPFQYSSQLLSTLRRYSLVSYDQGYVTWKELISLTKIDKFAACRVHLGWGLKSEATKVSNNPSQTPCQEDRTLDGLAKKLFGDGDEAPSISEEVTIEFRHYLKNRSYWICIKVSDESVSDRMSKFTRFRQQAHEYRYRIYVTIGDRNYIIAPASNLLSSASRYQGFDNISPQDKLRLLTELSKNPHQMNIIYRYSMLPLDANTVT